MRRCSLIGGALLLVLACAVVSLDPTYVLLGLLKNESFYQRRPTTYWSKEIQHARQVELGVESPSGIARFWTLLGITWEERQRRVDQLRLELSKDPQALPVLRELLHDRVDHVRWLAALTVVPRYAVPDTELVPILAEALCRAEDDEIRNGAVVSLEEFGPLAEPAIPALIVALGDHGLRPNPKGCSSTNRTARRVLYRLESSAVPRLIEALDDCNPKIRAGAAWALGMMGADGASATPALTARLHDRGMRTDVALALWRIDIDTPLTLPALLQALNDTDPHQRYLAAQYLGQMGSDARAAVPALIQGLKDGDGWVRRQVAITLGNLGPEARAAVPALRLALKDEDGQVREQAAEALAVISSDAEAAEPPATDADPPMRKASGRLLLEDVCDPRYWVHLEVDFLHSIDPPYQSEAAALLPIAADEGQPGYELAVDRLGRLPIQESAILSLLIELLDDGDYLLRYGAIKGLGRLGSIAKPAVPALQRKFEEARYVHWCYAHPRSVDRATILRAIWQINRRPDQVVPQISEMLRYTYWCWNSDLLTDILAEIGPDAREAVPALIKMMRFTGEDRYPGAGTEEIIAAVSTLGKIGPEAHAAIPFLKRNLKHPDVGLRRTAAEALRRITPKANAAGGS